MQRVDLETVHLDLGLGGDTLLDDKSSHLLTLVTLELDNLSELLVVNNGTVACEFLLEGLQQLLLVILCEVAESMKYKPCVRYQDTCAVDRYFEMS